MARKRKSSNTANKKNNSKNKNNKKGKKGSQSNINEQLKQKLLQMLLDKI